MWITRGITARTLIWLAAMTVPVQGLPAASCGCATSDQSRCQTVEQSKRCCATTAVTTKHSCCQEQIAGPCRCTGAKVCRCGDKNPCRERAHACCTERATTHSCCSSCDTAGESACPCGINCQCGQSKEPSKPAAPPVENNTAEKVASDSVSTVSLATVVQPPIARRTLDSSAMTDALAALDRCATLCRFTL